MGKKSTHWIRSIISVFSIAIVLFLAIYIFEPDLSLKFFKIGYKAEDRVAESVEDILSDEMELPKDKVDDYLNTEEGKKIVENVMEGMRKGMKGIKDALSDVDIEKIKDDIKSAPSKVSQ